ncbi:hypothetical protein C8Q76DRAFT_619389 [Earliella scabrosa]|nr:hypothetical protein C8Q76DRAFT_619389 [Earliella scabrosa]
MRLFNKVLLASGCVLVTLPLIAVVPLYLLHFVYAYYSPLPSSHPHLVDAMTSVHDLGLTLLCTFSIGVLLPIRCAQYGRWSPASKDPLTCSNYSEFVDAHQILFDNLSQHGSSIAADVASISTVEPAVDRLLSYDSHVMLSEDGLLDLQGVGNVSLLLEMARASRNVGLLMYQLLLHLELGLTRTIIVDVATLEHILLARVKDGFRFASAPTVDLAAFMSQSAITTLSSVTHLRTAAQDAADATRSLLEAFHNLEARRDADRLCSGRWSGALVCASVMAILREKLAVAMVGRDLQVLIATLEAAVEDLSPFQSRHAQLAICPTRVAEGLLRRELDVLWHGLVTEVQDGKRVVEIALFGDFDLY